MGSQQQLHGGAAVLCACCWLMAPNSYFFLFLAACYSLAYIHLPSLPSFRTACLMAVLVLPYHIQPSVVLSAMRHADSHENDDNTMYEQALKNYDQRLPA
jgi:hypothetical protein